MFLFFFFFSERAWDVLENGHPCHSGKGELATGGATTQASHQKKNELQQPQSVAEAGCCKMRAPVEAPTELRLRIGPWPREAQHAWCFRNKITLLTLHADLAMSLAKRKKMMEPNASWGTSRGEKDPNDKDPPCSNINTPMGTRCLKFTLISNPLPFLENQPLTTAGRRRWQHIRIYHNHVTFQKPSLKCFFAPPRIIFLDSNIPNQNNFTTC